MTGYVVANVAVTAPAEPVWNLLTDWDRQSEWIPATRVRSMNGRGVGGRISAWTGIGPLGFLDPMTVTVWDPPRVCEVRHEGRLFRGSGVFRVQALGPSRCQVWWEEHVELSANLLARIGWRIARPVVRVGLGVALRRFAAMASRS